MYGFGILSPPAGGSRMTDFFMFRDSKIKNPAQIEVGFFVGLFMRVVIIDKFSICINIINKCRRQSDFVRSKLNKINLINDIIIKESDESDRYI